MFRSNDRPPPSPPRTHRSAVVSAAGGRSLRSCS
jgi:hypothetical protein